MKTMTASLKNFADKFNGNTISETFEIQHNRRKLIFEKTSICWLLGKNSYKCSSDRVFRVRANAKKIIEENSKKNIKTIKKFKRFKILRKSKEIKKTN